MIDTVLSNKIHQAALNYGYDGCGIVALEELNEYKVRLKERMEKIPASKLVYGFADQFTHLQNYYPWAKSVIVCTFWLGKYKYPQSLQGRYGKAYMLSPDTVPDSPVHQKKLQFEDWLKKEDIQFAGGEEGAPRRLFPLRQAAVAAGLGIFRRNNFFYGEKGSYYMLEGYLIDKECEYKQQVTLRPCSETCGLCQKACPTHSLCAAYTMDPTQCVSFLTTFGGGRVPASLTETDLDTWICGCDACQDACPYNRRHNWQDGEDFYQLAELEDILQPQAILQASDEELREKVIPKTEFHLRPDQTDILRRCAARSLRNERGKTTN